MTATTGLIHKNLLILRRKKISAQSLVLLVLSLQLVLFLNLIGFAKSEIDPLHDLPKIRSVPKISDIDVNSYVGFFPSRSGINSYFFYWFVEHGLKDSAPLIFWFTGGPGCSSMRSFLTENGPVKVTSVFGDPKSTKIEKNLFSWSNFANLVYIDQPIGTGLSPYNNDQEQLVSSSQSAAIDMVTFFKNFFKTFVPYAQTPIYFGGDAYSAKMMLYLYSELKKNSDSIQINLQGFIFENPMFSPTIQYKAYSYQGFMSSILSYSAHVALNVLYEQCVKDIKTLNHDGMQKLSCSQIMPTLKQMSGVTNEYDIRKWQTPQIDFAEVRNFIATDTFYNQTLGIKHERLRSVILNFTLCSNVVASKFDNERYFDTPEEFLLEALNTNMRVLVMSGQFDFQVPVYGVTEYLRSLNWPYREQYNIAKVKLLTSLTDDVLAQYKQVNTLTHAIVYGAGHFISMDKPDSAQLLVKNFIKNNLCNNQGRGCQPDADECPNACSGNGICQADGSCKCNANYEGKDCSIGKFVHSLSKPETYSAVIFGREAIIYQVTVIPATTLLNVEIIVDKISSTGSFYVFANVSTLETDISPEIQKKMVRKNVELDLHGQYTANLGYKYYNLTNVEKRVFLVLSKVPVLFGMPNIISIAILNAIDAPAKFQMKVLSVNGLEIIHTFTLTIIFILLFLIIISFELGVIITRYRKTQARIRKRIFKYQKLVASGAGEEELLDNSDSDDEEDEEMQDLKNPKSQPQPDPKVVERRIERKKEAAQRKKKEEEAKKEEQELKETKIETKDKEKKKKEEERSLIKSGDIEDDEENESLGKVLGIEKPKATFDVEMEDQ